MTISKIISKIYGIILKNWFINFFVTVIPGLYFVVVKVCGKQIGCLDASGELSLVGNRIFWFLVVVVLILGAIKSWMECNVYQKTGNSEKILRSVIASTNSICDKKLDGLINYIVKNSNKLKIENIIYKAINPNAQISKILDDLGECLSKLTDIQKDNISLSVCEKINKNWKCRSSKNIINCNFDTIANNSSSTAKQIIDGNAEIVFYADKKIAISEGKYFPGKKDKNYSNSGSIICVDLSIKNGNRILIQAILNITTYNEKICEADDEETKNKIIDIIIQPFVLRLRMELCFNYIRDLYNKSKENNRINSNKNSKEVPFDLKQSVTGNIKTQAETQIIETAEQAAAISRTGKEFD